MRPRWQGLDLGAGGFHVRNPIPPKYRRVSGPGTLQIRRDKRPPLLRCGSLERGCQLRRRPCHLTSVRNYEVRPKIAVVLLQNGT
ncbi:hypothetical protein AVEN_122010-1 [Araneus ventricosus]|uniref:Uncharacterized protein n=1 Tax=Araneus ventricosus TaxID=182803 RepID=A0A4Y2RA93_ARAVE|nr:hypothetical protein AVEN_122010-1 [Araneus ventricosus]